MQARTHGFTLGALLRWGAPLAAALCIFAGFGGAAFAGSVTQNASAIYPGAVIDTQLCTGDSSTYCNTNTSFSGPTTTYQSSSPCFNDSYPSYDYDGDNDEEVYTGLCVTPFTSNPAGTNLSGTYQLLQPPAGPAAYHVTSATLTVKVTGIDPNVSDLSLTVVAGCGPYGRGLAQDTGVDVYNGGSGGTFTLPATNSVKAVLANQNCWNGSGGAPEGAFIALSPSWGDNGGGSADITVLSLTYTLYYQSGDTVTQNGVANPGVINTTENCGVDYCNGPTTNPVTGGPASSGTDQCAVNNSNSDNGSSGSTVTNYCVTQFTSNPSVGSSANVPLSGTYTNIPAIPAGSVITGATLSVDVGAFSSSTTSLALQVQAGCGATDTRLSSPATDTAVSLATGGQSLALPATQALSRVLQDTHCSSGDNGAPQGAYLAIVPSFQGNTVVCGGTGCDTADWNASVTVQNLTFSYIVPPADVTVTASTANAQQSVLTWKANGDPSGITYVVTEVIQGGGHSGNSHAVYAGAATAFAGSNLACGEYTQYQVAAQVTGDSGVLTSATASPGFSTTPCSVSVSVAGAGSLNVSWPTISGPSYVVFWCQADACSSPTQNVGGAGSHTITGLVPNTEYTVWACTTTDAAFCPAQSLWTDAAVPTDLTATVTQTGIAIGWSANGNPQGTSYEVVLQGVCGGPSTWLQSAKVSPTPLIYTFGGLEPGTAYTVNVAAVNNSSGATTLYDSSCPTPTSPSMDTSPWPTISSVTASQNSAAQQATISWPAVSVSGAPSGPTYVLQHETLTSSGVSQAWTTIYTGTATSFFTGYQSCGDSYVYRVQAQEVQTDWTTSLQWDATPCSVTATAEAPSTGLSGSQWATSGALDVSWPPLASGSDYRLVYAVAGQSQTSINVGSATSYRITGLPPNAQYDVWICSTTEGIGCPQGGKWTMPNPATGITSGIQGLSFPQVTIDWGANSNPSGTKYALVQQVLNASGAVTATNTLCAGTTGTSCTTPTSGTGTQGTGAVYAYQVESLSNNAGQAGEYTPAPGYLFANAPAATASAAETSSIQVSWPSLGNNTEYTVIWTPQGGAWHASPLISTDAYTISGLSPNTEYTVQVSAGIPDGTWSGTGGGFGGGGWWVGASPSPVWTDANPPSGLTVTTTGATSPQARITWSAAGNPSGTIYSVNQVVLGASGGTSASNTLCAGTAATSCATTDQQLGTVYEYSVQAGNGGGAPTAWVGPVMFANAPAPYAHPRTNGVFFTWPSLGNGVSYKVTSCNGGLFDSSWIPDTGQPMSWSATDLQPGTVYPACLEAEAPGQSTAWPVPLANPASGGGVMTDPSIPGTITAGGLLGLYYNDSSVNWSSVGAQIFTAGNLAAQYVQGPINFNIDANGWPNMPGGQNTNFGARYIGWLYAPTSGTYTIGCSADDSCQVWVDSALPAAGMYWVQPWGGGNYYASCQGSCQPGTTNGPSGELQLVGGKWYPIEVDYFQGGGGSYINLFWTTPGASSAATIPAADLGYPAPFASGSGNLSASATSVTASWLSDPSASADYQLSIVPQGNGPLAAPADITANTSLTLGKDSAGTAITCGTAYTASVRAKTGQGIWTGWSTLGSITTVPCPPSFTATDGGLGWSSSGGRGYVHLSWSPVQGATGYRVWIFEGSEYESFDVGSATSWNSQTVGVYPPDSSLYPSVAQQSQNPPLFVHDGGGLNLRDLPQDVYCTGTETHGFSGFCNGSTQNYWITVSAYNSSGDSNVPAGDDNPCFNVPGAQCYEPTLPLQTDANAPSISTLQINGGAADTYQAQVNLTIDASESPSGVAAYALSNDGSNWTTVDISGCQVGQATSCNTTWGATVPWTLTPGTGQKTVYVKAESTAGVWSAARTASIESIQDPAHLVVDAVLDGGAASTTSTSVTLGVTVTDSGVQSPTFSMRTSTNGGQTWSGWVAEGTGTSWTATETIPGGASGERTVLVQVNDQYSNVGQGGATIQYVNPTQPSAGAIQPASTRGFYVIPSGFTGGASGIAQFVRGVAAAVGASAGNGVVYSDPSYPYGMEAASPSAVATALGWPTETASALATWMQDQISKGTAAGSLAVLAQGVVPDTIAQSESSNVLLVQYMQAGGTVVWSGDVPMYYQGHSDGSSTTWDDGGAQAILGINAGTGYWSGGDSYTDTSLGSSLGLQSTGSLSSRSIAPGQTGVYDLATDTNGGWASWFEPFSTLTACASTVGLPTPVQCTTHSQITVTLAPPASAVQMRASLNGVTWGPWEPVSGSMAVNLGSSPGLKTVWVQYQDAQSNITDAPHHDPAYIVYDPGAPSVQASWVGNASATDSSGNATLQLQASDDVGQADQLTVSVTENGATLYSGAFENSIPLTLSGTGYQVVQVTVTDVVGNAVTSTLGIYVQ